MTKTKHIQPYPVYEDGDIVIITEHPLSLLGERLFHGSEGGWKTWNEWKGTYGQEWMNRLKKEYIESGFIQEGEYE